MGKSCLKKIFKRVFVLILCILVSGVSIVSVSGKAYAASTNFLSDETINKFIELFYDAGSEAAEGVYDILSGEKEGTYEEFKSIYKNISAFYGVIDKSEVFAETAARDAVANISRLNDIIGGCILIYDNAPSFLADSTNAIQKTVDGFQILKGVMSILGCGAYFPSGLSLALNVTEITINIAGYLETQYFKENVAFYEIDLQMAYFTGSELPLPEAPSVIGFKLSQEDADNIYAQTYMKYYLKQMMDRIGKPVSDGSGNTGNSITGGIVFEKSSYSIAMNETCKFTSSFYSSAEQTDIVITYSSSDTSVFTTTSDGLVTPVNEGTAQLIATASNGVTARCEIVVYTPKIYIEEILLPQETLELAKNMQLTLTAGYYPSDANTDIGITYSSSNKSVIEVDSTGTVTPVGSGTANIIATAGNGVQGVCEITVYPYYVNENDTGYTITRYLGSAVNESIPSSINSVPITRIEDGAFIFSPKLLSIDIPEGITSIGDSAFSYCRKLTNITIPDSVKTIGSSAFSYCNSLTTVNIGENVFYLGSYAFENCTSLTSISIPDSIRKIDDSAFKNCKNLTSINVDENNTQYSSYEGVLFNKDKTTLILYPEGKSDTEYIIPDSVTSIGSKAFYNCDNLTTITIPNGVINIDEEAFMDCDGFNSITIPDSVTSISSSAFSNCSNLVSLNANENNTQYSSYEGVLFNKDKTTLILYPQGKSEAEYIIPDSVINIGSKAFYNCDNLTSITISNNVTNIGYASFYDCDGFSLIIIPDGVTNIDSCAFGYTNIKSIIIPDSVINIDYSAFVDCDVLTDVYYLGLLDNWDNIQIDSGNDCLTNATISHFCTHSDWAVKVEPTCTNNGSRSKTCIVCGDIVIETIEATGHSYSNEWTIDVAPTCTEEGRKSHHCTTCGDKTDITVIVATGHNYEVTKALSIHPHTVTYICSYCDDEKTETLTIPDCIECICGTETPIKGTENTKIDFNKFLVFTSIRNCSDIIEIISVSENATVEVIPSFKNGVTERYGTGTIVTVFDGDKFIGDFTLIVEGDTNGDSICNVLDVFDAERASSGNNELSGAYAIAADINSDDAIDINDYQAIVNKALAS